MDVMNGMDSKQSHGTVTTEQSNGGSLQWCEDAASSRGDFTLAGSMKLAKHIEEQVKANVLSEHKRGSKLVYIALLFGSIAFGLVTFFLIRTSQQNTFQSEFESFARETADIAEKNAESTFGQLKHLALAITSIANAHESTDAFPNITVPHFDLRAQEIADHTGVEMIAFVPFVCGPDKEQWESYAVDHQYWVMEGYDHRGWNTMEIESIPHEIYNYTIPSDYNDTRHGFVDDGFMQEIKNKSAHLDESGRAPISQFGPGPSNTSLAMLDLLTHPIFKKEMLTSLEYDVPVISEVEDLEFLLEHIVADRDSPRDYSLLRSFTLDPVKESFNEGAKTVGYIVGVVPWESFFRNLLPETVNGVVVKVVSDCGKNITYVVNGGKEDWAAEGDWHDPKYDNMVQQYQFFWKDHPMGVSRHCHFDFHIYPSDEFASHYQSDDPIVYALVVLSVCLFMGIVFYGYDRYMEQRQKAVMSEKARTNAVVTALFPTHISARLLKEKEGRQSISNVLNLTNENGSKTKPLADLYPSATIMFSDIAGFTAWSSAREPTMVFTLLEALYERMDEIAREREVLKVETIGDCYVAVVGLPNQQPRHAEVMCMFASDCLKAFYEVVSRLKGELGPGTEGLGLRTGIHSGPVTAGVLRGERARFQLFGDSVNTTARIESNGKAGHIHLSQQTAEQLQQLGREDWLVQRKDKVEAKGKGLLTTYWLVMDHTKPDSSESSTETGFTDEYAPAQHRQ